MTDITYLRHFRIGQYPIFDIAVSYLGVFLLAPVMTKICAKIHLNISTVDWMWLTLPLSVLFHFVFHQQTPFMKTLFNPNHYYIEVIVIISMLYMGLRNVWKTLNS